MYFVNHIYSFSFLPDSVIHGISTKHFGVIKKSKEVFPQNFSEFLRVLKIPYARTVVAGLVHGKDVAVVTDTSPSRIENVDGLITTHKNIFLWIGTADCLPIVWYDKRQKIVGICHAGYKGILAGIVENMISQFVALGTNLEDLQVGIGPGIGVCCYNVAKERIDQFVERFGNGTFYEKRGDEYFLNLTAVVTKILHEKGILQRNIEQSDLCTKDHQEYFYSHRGSNNTLHDDFVTIIGMKE